YPGACNFGINFQPGGNLQWYLRDQSVWGYQYTAYAPMPAARRFHHLAATFHQPDTNHIELKTYLDGELVQTGTVSGNLANTLNDTPLTIGASSAEGEFFTGIIDEVAIYNR